VIRGTALVNSSLISRGVALVNGLEVVIENGVPTGRGIALVNGLRTLRGIALVNGLPLIRGTALVNNLEVHVDDGEVDQVFENGTALVNGLTMSRGIALVNGTALVNGSQLISRGTALVNGIALTDEEGDGEDLVDLENMNFMASSAAIANGLNSLRGTALVNGLESEDGEALKVAAGTVQEDGSIVFENGITSRGIALVNGLNYVRGTALVNGSPLNVRGTALVNGSTINDSTNSGTILVFDATELGETNDNVGFTPISFITGTTVGQHWIVPGTYISNNFEISYGLGTLTIDPAPLTITADDKSKTFGEEDPALTKQVTGLLGQDTLSGELIREEGEDAGDYAILQGSLTTGENYTVHYDSAVFTIDPASMTVSITAESKVYDGIRTAVVSLSDNRLVDSDLDITYTSALFADKNVGEMKDVTVIGLSLSGPDADNYAANTEAVTAADITAKDLVIDIAADSKTYDGTAVATTLASVTSGLIDEDDVTVSSSNGLFDDKNVGTGKAVTADISTSGLDAGNYAANTEAVAAADITAKDLLIDIAADSKIYDGSAMATTIATISSGLVDGDAVTVVTANGMFNNKSVGTGKPVTADISTSGLDAENYAANVEAATTADITAKDLLIDIAADSKTYDGTAVATTLASVTSGLIDEDDITVSSSNGLFDDKNVGTDKAVTADISTSGLDAGNYAANAEAVTAADITAKDLVIDIAADSKIYDGTATATTLASVTSGLVDGDAVTVSSSNGLFDDKNAGMGKPVTADVSTSGADADNYAANAEAATTASISAINLEIGITALDKAYDGTASATTLASVTSGLVVGDAVTVSSSNGLFNDKNAGMGKPVTADVFATGADAVNYTVNETASTTATISPINLEIGITATDKDYDGTAIAATSAFVESGLLSGDVITVSSSSGSFDSKHVGANKPVTADVSASGLDALNYTVNVEAATMASISPINLEIGINADNKVYDGTYVAITTAFVSSGLIGGDAVTVSSANGLFLDKNVGTWSLTADVYTNGADAGNYLANGSAVSSADITPREVSVTSYDPFLYIREGDPLPVFAFSYMDWIPGDAGNEGYTVLRDSDGVPYSQSSNKSAGSYTVTPVPTNSNYTFALETGVLHVNPYGPGTRAVKPVLNCIEEIDANYYIANFEYKNENDVAVYIPEGDNNILTGSGIDWENFEGLPTMFEPGGGTFIVYFDGSELSWTVNSRDQNQKVSNSANANSSSTKCQTNIKSAQASVEIVEEELDPDQLVAYPNPVVNKVYLSMKDIENYKLIQLYDFTGRVHAITSIDKRADLLEIEMAQLSSGNYFIRVIMEDDSSRVVQIIKE